MCNGRECSNRKTNTITLWAHHLMCLRCQNGGGNLPFMEKHGLAAAREAIRANPDIHITFHTAFDEIGARTSLYGQQTKEERRRDLIVLQRLGLVPGDTRTAREILPRLNERVPDNASVCGGNGTVWAACPLAAADYYEQGKTLYAPHRTDAQLAACKTSSCEEIADAEVISIRAHHLLCLLCFISRGHDGPIDEDNLYEIFDIFRKNPEIPVRIVEGAGECMVCPPCDGFLPERGLCVRACHLRDRRKDLETMFRIGVETGDVLPAGELYRRIFENIPHVEGICAYEMETNPEWAACGSARTGGYQQGLARMQKELKV